VLLARRAWIGRIAPVAALAALAACADDRQLTVAKPASSPAATSSNWAPFTCGVTFQTTTTLNDAELASYGVPEITEGHRTCETWTGNDYRLYVQETSTSTTDPEVKNDVTTTWYEYGYSKGYDANGVQVDAAQVAPDAFALGHATPEERQASYNDPYYAVYQGTSPEPCPNNPNAIICDTGPTPNRVPGAANRSVSPGGSRNPYAAAVGKNEHGVRRRALRALLASSDEIGRSAGGHRRFRSVKGDEETVITVDPATELMVAQEVRGPAGKTRTRFTWAKARGTNPLQGYVRERMDVDTEDAHGRKTGHASVTITDISFAGGNP